MCEAKQLKKLRKAMLRAFFPLPDWRRAGGDFHPPPLWRVRVKLPISYF